MSAPELQDSPLVGLSCLGTSGRFGHHASLPGSYKPERGMTENLGS